MGFHKDEAQSFYVTAALSALAAELTVDATGDSACTVYANTAAMKAFNIRSN